MCCSVVTSGQPSSSRASATSLSSGARDALTISKKAAVFGGGAFGSNSDRSSLPDSRRRIHGRRSSNHAYIDFQYAAGELFFWKIGPGDEVAAVIGRQIDAIRLVVGRDDHAADIEDGVFAQVFLVDAEHVGRRGGVGLHVIVESEAVELAEIARLRSRAGSRISGSH